MGAGGVGGVTDVSDMLGERMSEETEVEAMEEQRLLDCHWKY